MRVVSISNHTGATEREKLNMAIVIHYKDTKKMEYKHKSENSNSWKYYQPYLYFQTLPKFANLRPMPVVKQAWIVVTRLPIIHQI